MKYMLMIYRDEALFAAAPRSGPHSAAYVAYTDALKQAGAWISGDRLQVSETGSTVRVADGKTEILDGPYAESKEQLGGYYIIEAPDLDKALEWAAKCPGAVNGAIEVRPLWAI